LTPTTVPTYFAIFGASSPSTIANHCHLYRINGVQDHIHILSSLHPTVALADLVKNIKLGSSSWIKESGKFPRFRHWQDGYGAFTASWSERNALIEYIKNQEAHHRRTSFLEEYRSLLKEAGIDFEERIPGLETQFDPEGGRIPFRRDHGLRCASPWLFMFFPFGRSD
jgi:hypothetical protein